MARPLILVGLLGACSSDAAPHDAASHDPSTYADASSPADGGHGDAATTATDASYADASGPDASRADAGTTTNASGPVALAFPPGSFFRNDVSKTPKSASSDRAIAALRKAGGFGNGDRFQIDFSLDLLRAGPSDERRTLTPRTKANGFPDDEFATPDCDVGAMPLPLGGHVEGEDGYACAGNGDCHLLVWSPGESRLFEMWRADLSGGVFSSAGLVAWDTEREVGLTGRGLQCTSADAAGFPIAPLLFSADEVAAGSIDHAIRFILPNDRVQRGFVPPATHGSKTTGGADAPFYGVHLRLRADYPVAQLPSEGARVVARALQRYGMFHADGGEIALTAQSDRSTVAKWDGLLGPHDLRGLRVEDFDVIDHGPSVELTFDCVRNGL